MTFYSPPQTPLNSLNTPQKIYITSCTSICPIAWKKTQLTGKGLFGLHTVLLVDDEIYTRQGIRNLID